MARYIDKIIKPDETILFDGKVHWGIYIWPTFWTLITLGWGLFFTIFWYLYALIYQLNSDFVVTDKRLIAKFGFISRTTIEQRLNKIDSVIVNQGLLGRILNYGKIHVQGTGVTTTPFGPIADPLGFKRAVEDAIDSDDAKRRGNPVN